ncbi:hypothetical protein N9R79_03795 [Vibrio sp.]|nr:hypothetical protein [Vibrio sp.]
MFNILKLVVLVCGAIAIYGYATDQDINDLMGTFFGRVTPVVEELFAGLVDMAKNMFNKAT